MKPVIDHIQITVKDLDSAELFYDKLFPILGFDIKNKLKAFIAEHDSHVIEYSHDSLAFAITSPREAFKNKIVNRRKPEALHHLAFRADSKLEVDDAYEKLLDIGANIVLKPAIHPEYSENYYAVYFKDNQNIKYEIVSDKK
jgi:catechol 2,3-dioxygenase-like lactoylglutathione lyase family enzyme